MPTEVHVTIDFEPDGKRNALVAYCGVRGLMERFEVASMSFWLLGDDPNGPAASAFRGAVRSAVADRAARHGGRVVNSREEKG